MEKITSKNNNLVKDTKKLLTSSKYRREQQLFVLEGARLCFDVLNSFYKVKYFLITDTAYNKYIDQSQEMEQIADNSYLITDEIANRLTDTNATQGVFCVCKMQDWVKILPTVGKLIALDNVQDPSNLGPIIRTAEALGIGGVITYNTCDIFNPKALRGSMGSILRMNIIDTNDLKSSLLTLKGDGFKIYSTVPDSKATNITSIEFTNKTVCVIGNEANGVEEEIKNISSELITIPMLGRSESLNAGVAASITMWEMLRE